MRAIAAALLLATPAIAEESFVESNILGIFYHELGHAVIHLEGVPIFGQEEDAADVFSIFMIDALFEPEVAIDLAYDASFGFLGEVELRDYDVEDIAWWDVHGPDEQRFYNTVCIFYGADPDARQGFADDLGLPQDRAEYCPEEYDQANASWGAILDKLAARGGGTSISFDGDDSLTGQIIGEEIKLLNEEFQLSQPLTVVIESCGEANAFYDPQDQAIIMCSEFEDHLFEMAKALQ